MHQQNPNYGPFGNTCEADEVSPEVEAGVVAGLSVCNLAGTQICDYNTLTKHLAVTIHQYLTSIYFADKTLITEQRSIQPDLTHLST
jgi:hypothetical protein